MNEPERPVRQVPAILWIAPAALVVDLVLGGPLGVLPTLHGRHLLFGTATASLVAMLLLARGLDPRALSVGLLCVALFAWSLIWMTIVPSTHEVPAAYTLAEADAILMLIPITLAVLLLPRQFPRVRRLIVASTIVLACVQVVIWVCGQVSYERGLALADRIEAFYGNQSMYTGAMPNGVFRVFWISSLWCLLGLFWLPVAVRSRVGRFAGAALLATAVLGTYSRGLWIGFAAGLFTVLFIYYIDNWRRIVQSLVLIAVALAALVIQVDYVRERVVALAAIYDDPSMIERGDQMGPVIRLWRENPLVGVGFGGFAESGNSDDAPFSYEMVPVALLMKMGVLGATGVAVFWLLVLWRALTEWRSARAEVALFAGGAAALLVAWSTNPLFLNFVGMGVCGALLLNLAAIVCHATSEAAPGPVAPYQ